MEVLTKKNGTELTISLKGRLDTTSAPQLDEVVKSSLDGVTMLIMDFNELDYISSAGLRIILSSQKVMNKQGKMVIRGANDVVRDAFDMTGFLEILTLED